MLSLESTMMPPVGKIRTLDPLQQRFRFRIGLVDQMQRRVAKLGRVVRRDRGGHADGDALRAVRQQIREAARQHHSALSTGRHSSGETRRRPRRCPRARAARLRSCALRCSDRRRDYRRRCCRNCPARPPADSARRNPARGAPARRRSIDRRADGTSPSRRRRSWRTFLNGVPGSSRSSRMPYRMRRCTGFRPSRASGNARCMMVESA